MDEEQVGGHGWHGPCLFLFQSLGEQGHPEYPGPARVSEGFCRVETRDNLCLKRGPQPIPRDSLGSHTPPVFHFGYSGA